MALHSQVWKPLSSARGWPSHFESLLSPGVLLCFVSCWPSLPFPDRPSWQFPALQLYSWATATQAYVSPNQSAPINLYYSFRALILLFACAMEFCAILWVFLWSHNWKLELRHSEIQRSSRMVACEWGTYAFTCRRLSFLSPAADRIWFEV